MNKVRLAALFCIVLFAIGLLSAQSSSGQMGTPSTRSPQMQQPSQTTPATPPEQSAPPSQSTPQASGRMSNIDDQVKTLSDNLNLNTDQQSKVRSILMDQHEQAMALVQDNSTSREDKVAKIHSLRASTIAKVRGLLNTDQQTKFDAMVQQQDDHIKQRQDQGGTGSPSGTSPSSTSPANTPPTGAKPPR